MATNPIVHRRQLGAELRRLREAAGLGAKDAAKALRCDPSRVSRIELGRGTAVAKADDVRTLCKLYGVADGGKVDALLDMVTSSQQRGWWQTYEGVLPSGLDTLMSLETTAHTERAWEPLLVHGLLQTPDYARAVLNSARIHRPSDIDDLVQVRSQRARLMEDREPLPPLNLWLVLDEAALIRPLGGPAVMREQLNHLREMADSPQVTIQVYPLRKHAHPSLGGAFSMLEFDTSGPVVYVDSPAGNLYLEKQNDVRRFAHQFDLLKASACDPDESTALLERAAEEMR
ncbi:helix-turn-helix domain-containing protein [Streptomyces boncukensis]|uniref:Helix-turn-helix domain-containing protein n=1 Tax=Streptomyces boncukensis TaxID=2711219 RepID=A0A6G4WTU8_9ACTN|nr:helix-turn-helix transcriptional regulator [Streptomyces boncukensis]NGO68272.1 helix-turn-helix domain-containing protein [Streptomyces boncukensis]